MKDVMHKFRKNWHVFSFYRFLFYNFIYLTFVSNKTFQIEVVG